MSVEDTKKVHFKKISEDMDEIVCVIDKIGSGFKETEEMSLALLLFFKEKRILNKLSYIRKIVQKELSELMTDVEYDEWIERDTEFWNPPYCENYDELLNRIKTQNGI